MNLKLASPFNLFGWSIAILILFVIIQVTIRVAYAMWGRSISPFVGLFTWFAVCTALGFSIYTKYKPHTSHMLLLQGLACFYVFAISVGLMLKNEEGLALAGFFRGFGVTLALYAIGYAGFALSSRVRQWKSV